MFLALDANFRLTLKDRKINDPELGSGWAYFVEIQRYLEHISQATNGAEVTESSFGPCYCPNGPLILQVTGCGSDFHAVNRANSKPKGYVATGVVACVCARHSLVQKNGVGDLQRGERYGSSSPLNPAVG